MKNFLSKLFSIDDYFVEDDWSLMTKINELEERISVLESENISLTNELYRLENSLDARIDLLFQNLHE